MERDDAQEFLEINKLGQQVSFRTAALGIRLGVHKALGITRKVYISQLGGTANMEVVDRQEAIPELQAEGHSNREIADILGVDEKTIRNDLAENSAEGDENSFGNGHENNGSAENSADGEDREWDEPEHIWHPSEVDRKNRAEAGECVVANLRGDGELLAWAKAEDRYVRIDRQTDWGNPFEIPEDGQRSDVVEKFAKFYMPNKGGLQKRLSELRGKVLGCWCHPEECHGHIIANLVNHKR